MLQLIAVDSGKQQQHLLGAYLFYLQSQDMNGNGLLQAGVWK